MPTGELACLLLRFCLTCQWHRQLTLVLSALVFVVNLATACFTSSLPDEPHHIAPRMALYSYFACGAGILGFIGAKAVRQ